MTTKLARRVVFYSAMVLGGIATTMGSGPVMRVPSDNPVSLFRARVAGYTQLRQQIVANLQEDGLDPSAEDGGREFRHALGLAIREARRHAQPGEIFCAEIAGHIRRRVLNALQGEDDILSEVPEVTSVRVNDFYPEGEPLTTVPPSLLQELEPLPPELQYRFLASALILLDIDTALIVDFIPNAFQRSA
jgi:hypothetical protein